VDTTAIPFTDKAREKRRREKMEEAAAAAPEVKAQRMKQSIPW
jgi:hypothetical protein